MTSVLSVPTMFLVPVSGPPLAPIELSRDKASHERGLTIGRSDHCDIVLPPNADTVSRFHASLRLTHNGQWLLTDTASSWGTFVNGTRLKPERSLPLIDNDLIRIAPWTFRFCDEPDVVTDETTDDTQTVENHVRMLDAHTLEQPLQDDLLTLLLEASSSLHTTNTEVDLASRLLDIAIRGTGLLNAAFVLPMDTNGRIELLATRGPDTHRDIDQHHSHFPISRTLINAASTGSPTIFSAGEELSPSASLARMNVEMAICVPLMLGETIAAFLYLDTRTDSTLADGLLKKIGQLAVPPAAAHQPIAADTDMPVKTVDKHPEHDTKEEKDNQKITIRQNAPTFAMALARIASLALAHQKRIDIERRQVATEKELATAGEAQRLILPARKGTADGLQYIGESRPGQSVGGDFFLIMEHSPSQVIVALGDVAGKGIPASVLMSLVHGFLHAAIPMCQTPVQIVEQLNKFLCPRMPVGRFVTLFCGSIDTTHHQLTYVDAGHGYAFLQTAAGHYRLFTPEGEGDIPLGIDKTTTFSAKTIAFAPKNKLLLVSDGLIEQNDPTGQPFDTSGLLAAMIHADLQPDPIASLFQTIHHYAKAQTLSDDATALLVAYCMPQ